MQFEVEGSKGMSETLRRCCHCSAMKWYREDEEVKCPQCGKHPHQEEREGQFGIINNIEDRFVRFGHGGMHVRSRSHFEEELKRASDRDNTTYRIYED